MATRKYDIREKDGFGETSVYGVTWQTGDRLWPEETAYVWWGDGRGNCTKCHGPLSAMSGSCAHVKAVRRHLTRQGQED